MAVPSSCCSYLHALVRLNDFDQQQPEADEHHVARLAHACASELLPNGKERDAGHYNALENLRLCQFDLGVVMQSARAAGGAVSHYGQCMDAAHTFRQHRRSTPSLSNVGKSL
jgi:hypothetical protein